MDLTQSVKRAPRWAWYTVGGVGIGALGIHFWKNRTTSTGATPAAGSATDPTVMGTPSVVGTGGSSPGYVVPPTIVTSSPADQSGTGLGALQDLFMGGVQDLISTFSTAVPQTYADIYGPVQSGQVSLISGIVDQMNAGSAPQPAVTNPTPLVVAVPAAVAAAPATPTPTPGGTPPPKSSDPCPGSEYPFSGPHGCFKVVCASGKGDATKGRWHYYSSGAKEHIASTC